jgi:glucokinase-like ROK family protein
VVNLRKSADKNLIRRLNIALILNYLRTTHWRTRASLAAASGLTRATVSSLVEELIALNLVRETGLQLSQGGRPGTGLELNPAGGCAIGIEIGVGFVSAVLTDFVANVQWRDRVEFDTKNAEEVIAIAEQLAHHAEQQSKALGWKLLGIGLGLPGLVKTDEGLLKFAPNLGWRDIPFQAMWEKRFGVPVHAVNEGSAAALGEHYFGIAADYHDFIYLSASSVGLGAGIMIDGKLFQGIDGYAGEVGHMVLDPAGPLCACGRHGCWEKVAGSPAVIKYVVDQCNGGRSSKVLEMAQGNLAKLTIDLVAQAASEGDSVAYEALSRVSHLFGVGIINLINTFNPQLIVIGGTLSSALKPFLPMIENVINQQAFRALSDDVAIEVSQLGDDACVMGAVAAVLDIVFADPTRHLRGDNVSDVLALAESPVTSQKMIGVP